MKTISKIICGIFLVIILFIVVNLVIGAVQYGGTKNYSEYLNNKSWKDSIEQVYILKPKTRLSIFYEVGLIEYNNLKQDNNEEVSESDTTENDNSDILLSGDDTSEIMNESHNPYDPDYEDEFNSFFGVATEKTGEIIPIQEIEDLEPAGFVVDENTEY